MTWPDLRPDQPIRSCHLGWFVTLMNRKRVLFPTLALTGIRGKIFSYTFSCKQRFRCVDRHIYKCKLSPFPCKVPKVRWALLVALTKIATSTYKPHSRAATLTRGSRGLILKEKKKKLRVTGNPRPRKHNLISAAHMTNTTRECKTLTINPRNIAKKGVNSALSGHAFSKVKRVPSFNMQNKSPSKQVNRTYEKLRFSRGKRNSWKKKKW